MNLLNEWFLTGEGGDCAVLSCLGYSYNYWLVTLSILVAVLASYSAIHLVSSMSKATNKRAKYAWLATGSISMGGGIWAMHFIAMLAVQLTAHVHYDGALTLLSACFAIIASGCAFLIITSGERTLVRLWGGGIVLGTGIGVMHYTGMAAMHMDASIRYDPVMFFLSAVAAVTLSTLSLRLILKGLETSTASTRPHRILGSCAMGLSVAAMHYTGMAATYFLPSGTSRVLESGLETSLLAIIVAAGAILIVSLTLISSMLDQALKIKRLEADLNEQSLNAIIDHVGDAIIAIDHQGIIQNFNPAAERMFGYARDEIIGENVAQLATPEHQAHHDQYLDSSTLHVQRVLGQTRPLKGQRKGGETFDIEINISAMESDGKRMFIGVCNDVTMRRRVEAALRDAKESADTANRAKSEFLAKMSHELRTPLNSVIGFSELIKNQALGPVGSPEYREYATDIHDSGHHLLSLVNDILDLSKIEAGETELNEEEFNVEEEVRAVLSFVRLRAEKDNISLKIDAPEFPPRLYADRRMIKQILTNLLSNAIKFTESGGTVTLKYWDQDESGYVFQVSDTGVGIAVEDIPRSLAPFSQVGNKLDRKHEGTGLGLPLTKSMVELHGGSLDLQSQVGVGTTVTVSFPAERVRKMPEALQSKSA